VGVIRPCRDDERPAVLAIVNAAAEAYRGVIPEDRWHEPYMDAAELDREIAAGVVFWGFEEDGELVGVMGIQPVGDVDLIRHAYVRPGRQRGGIGGVLQFRIDAHHVAKVHAKADHGQECDEQDGDQDHDRAAPALHQRPFHGLQPPERMTEDNQAGIHSRRMAWLPEILTPARN